MYAEVQRNEKKKNKKKKERKGERKVLFNIPALWLVRMQLSS